MIAVLNGPCRQVQMRSMAIFSANKELYYIYICNSHSPVLWDSFSYTSHIHYKSGTPIFTTDKHFFTPSSPALLLPFRYIQRPVHTEFLENRSKAAEMPPPPSTCLNIPTQPHQHQYNPATKSPVSPKNGSINTSIVTTCTCRNLNCRADRGKKARGKNGIPPAYTNHFCQVPSPCISRVPSVRGRPPPKTV